MRFKPEKIFVKTSSGIYEELSYRQFCEAKENNADFTKKFFIPVQGMLLEVSKEDYKLFYKVKRRKKYVAESRETVEEIEFDECYCSMHLSSVVYVSDLEDEAVENSMIAEMKECLKMLSEEEQFIIKRSYFDNLSERDLAKELQVSQVLINKRKTLILKKLKKLLES